MRSPISDMATNCRDGWECRDKRQSGQLKGRMSVLSGQMGEERITRIAYHYICFLNQDIIRNIKIRDDNSGVLANLSSSS